METPFGGITALDRFNYVLVASMLKLVVSIRVRFQDARVRLVVACVESAGCLPTNQ